MDNDKYISLLKWGREHIDGVSHKELKDKLDELKLPSHQDGMAGCYNAIYKNVFIYSIGKFYLTFDAYFELHEHERLEEARQSSKQAMKVATWSIKLTIIALIISAIIGIWQICIMYNTTNP